MSQNGHRCDSDAYMLRAAVGSALTRPTLPHATHSCRKGRVRAHKAYEENGLRVPYCAGGTLEPKTTGRTGGTIKFTKTTQHVKSPRVCAFRPPRTDASRRARDETEPAPRTPGQKMGPFPGPKWVAQKVKVNNIDIWHPCISKNIKIVNEKTFRLRSPIIIAGLHQLTS